MIKFTDINSRKTILNGQDQKIDYNIFFHMSLFFPWEKKFDKYPERKYWDMEIKGTIRKVFLCALRKRP